MPLQPLTGRQLMAAGKEYAGWINDAVGAGLLNDYRANVQHPFDRIFFRNTADLAGKTINFFQTALAGTYNVLNGGGSQITKTAEDTNWDQQNQAQYSYLLTGWYFKIQPLEYQSFQAAPADLSTWSDTLRTLLEDSSLTITVEDNILTRQKAVHVPEGNAVTGVSAVTGTNAAPIAQPNVHSGIASAGNIFGFGRMALWIPKGTRFNVGLTFGASALTASMAYKPAANKIFAEVRFQGVKFQPVV